MKSTFTKGSKAVLQFAKNFIALRYQDDEEIRENLKVKSTESFAADWSHFEVYQRSTKLPNFQSITGEDQDWSKNEMVITKPER